MKKLISLLLVLVMVCSVVPMNWFVSVAVTDTETTTDDESDDFDVMAAQQTVKINIYRNGDTQNVYKSYNLSGYEKGDIIYASDIDLSEYYSSENGFEYAGPFNDGGWNSFKKNGSAAPFEKLTINGWTNIYYMVTDYEKVVVNAVVNGDKDNKTTLVTTKALKGSNLVNFLNENVEVPERTGYTSDKWYNWDVYGDKFDSNTTVSGETTVYVTYTANNYTLTLADPANAEYEYTKTVTFDAKVGELPELSRAGYTFLGWFYEATGEQYTAETVYKAADDLTLTAKWEANAYTVTLDANGGSVSPETKAVTYDAAVGELPVATKAGYTFLGWFDEATGEQYTSETVYKVAGELTLTARYDAKTYTLIFDANIGKVTPDTKAVVYDEAVGELPVPKKLGYTFVGWFDEATGEQYTAETVYKATDDLKLTARWTSNGKTYGKWKLTAEEIVYYVGRLSSSTGINKVALKLANVALKLAQKLDDVKLIDLSGLQDMLYEIAADLIENPVKDYWTTHTKV